MYKMKITGDEGSPINRVRKRFNDESLWYRFKIHMEVRVVACLLDLEYIIKRIFRK